MIIIDESGFPTLDSINAFCDEIKKNAYKEEYVIVSDMYREFLLDCFEADKKLQQLVNEKIGEQFICFVILPIHELDNFDSISFQMASEDDIKIKKRQERIFRDLCNSCFKNIKPFYSRLVEYYESVLEP